MRECAESLVVALRARGQTLAVAESCTGGLLGAYLTSVPGCAEVFWGGAISYDDAAKRELLGVSGRSLREHGAVSREVAVEMARGIRARAGATWAIAITGIAGPSGGSPDKPVGTVWIALEGPCEGVQLYRFDGDREAVREATVKAAIRWLASCVTDTEREAGERQDASRKGSTDEK